ncbi:hypothetical protein M758_6G166500 [Ceratodon purpureus]|nr:hypothetical protein M758_6G166500 [Ceratodon purpureus]
MAMTVIATTGHILLAKMLHGLLCNNKEPNGQVLFSIVLRNMSEVMLG